jgi:ABC-2 type transport system permease protein
VDVVLATAYPPLRDMRAPPRSASPVLYTVSTVQKPFITDILHFNPLTGILEALRYLMIDAGAPGPIHAWGDLPQALVPIATILVLFGFGLWYFNRQARTAAELL